MPARTKHETNDCKRSGFKTIERDLPGGAVAKTLHLQCGGTGVLPSQGDPACCIVQPKKKL